VTTDYDLLKMANDGLALRTLNEENGLKQWGLVMIRCTYDSQEKWDTFIKIVKERTIAKLSTFDEGDAAALRDTVAWTIIEDPQLDGASIIESSRRFHEWVKTEGPKEKEGSVYEKLPSYCARYEHFIHVDEPMLDAMWADVNAHNGSDGPEKWSEKNDYMIVVNPSEVMHLDAQLQARGQESFIDPWTGNEHPLFEEDLVMIELDDDDEEGFRSKKMKAPSFFDIYWQLARFPGLNTWELFYIHDDGFFWTE